MCFFALQNQFIDSVCSPYIDKTETFLNEMKGLLTFQD